jgi:hypothetical protein
MTIEEINSMWAEDAKIDESNIGRESAKIPELHNKYYLMYVKEALKSRKLKSDLKELEKAKTEYYNGSMDQEELKLRGWKPNPLKILRQDIDKYIESDKDIIQLSLRIAYHDSTAKYLEDIVKQINNRNFIIKNIIDWAKFTNGSN